MLQQDFWLRSSCEVDDFTLSLGVWIASGSWGHLGNVGALIIRMGFGGTVYCAYNKEGLNPVPLH